MPSAIERSRRLPARDVFSRPKGGKRRSIAVTLSPPSLQHVPELREPTPERLGCFGASGRGGRGASGASGFGEGAGWGGGVVPRVKEVRVAAAC